MSNLVDKLQLPLYYPVTAHTDFVGKASIFVAIPGTQADGLDYIPLALEKGARTIVVQSNVIVNLEIKRVIDNCQAKLVVVDNCRKALAEMSAEAFGYPAKKLKIIGVTGTKGKTSTSYMIYHMLKSLGKKVALSTTVEKLINDQLVKVPLTTPLPDQLHMFLDLCVQQKVEYVILESSAQALTLHRLQGIRFEAGVFTNFSMEHLEFYETMQDYFQAKCLLIDQMKDKKNFFVNVDDQYGQLVKRSHPEVATFSLENKLASIYGWSHLQKSPIGLHVKIQNKNYMFKTLLLGKFNAYNMLSALGVVHSLGLDIEQLAESMKSLKVIPGRMEQYRLKNNAQCFIDYAHNPSSFEAVLSTLRQMTSHLIVVFGAGGCRDKNKRPIMGTVAQKYGDIVVLTSDNPRDEDPVDIINDIKQGFSSDALEVYTELNRTKAIELSYGLSKPESVIAVLGKGRDEYQIVGDLTFPFKERSIIKRFIRQT